MSARWHEVKVQKAALDAAHGRNMRLARAKAKIRTWIYLLDYRIRH